MSIDVSQFHQVFFDESFEGLDEMEAGLLGMQAGRADADTINSIFRAAHSIKGGAGTFGFAAVSSFTHGLETLLDQMRNGERDVSQHSIDILLQAVDTLREMLTAVQQAAVIDTAAATQVSAQIESLLQQQAGTTAAQPAPAVETEQAWQIDFKPHRHLLQSGNDPLRLLQELAGLGDLTVALDTAALPAFSELEPEDCYLAWRLELRGEVSLAQINEIFEWVEGDCELKINPLPAGAELTAESAASEPLTEASALKQAAPNKATLNSSLSSMRVSTDKVDSLVNLVGELVITQSMLSQLGENFEPEQLPRLIDGLAQLARHTRELQEGIMRIRMLPISFAFNRLPRLVHDLSAKMGKQVELTVSGEQTELDKTVMEKIGDPLLHLVRNALDHGLETPDQRRAANKPETGSLQLNAYQQSGSIVIEISDDGAGLNADKIFSKALERGLIDADATFSTEQIQELIFLPGFSTAEAVSDVSGRGVGMDVVRKNIHSLGGSVEVSSQPGLGTRFSIRLPLTLAIMDGQIIQLGDERYILPLVSIVESLEIDPASVKQVTGKGELYRLRDEYLPMLRLSELFNLRPHRDRLEDALLVVVEFEDRKLGLLVDELLAQQQVVIKSLESNYRKVTGIAGATILGDGAVALILDIAGLLKLYQQPSRPVHAA